jgi:hypothetical protein
MRRSLVIRVSPLSANVVKELLRELMLTEAPAFVNFREKILAKHKASPASVSLLCEALEGATLDLGDAA